MKQNQKSTFKGNKQALPSKPCLGCGLPMTWRKRWARTWDEVKFCSDACRQKSKAGKATLTDVSSSPSRSGVSS